METYELLFGLGLGLCVISVAILSTIQIKMALRHGVYKSAFKTLDKKEIKKAKTSGILFLIGVIIIILGGLIQNNAL